MKDLGVAKQILGMEMHRDMINGKLWLSQHRYLENILTKFRMKDVKPVRNPFSYHFKFSVSLCPREEEEKEYMSHVPYASTVGSLMYVMVCTRPYISHVVGFVNRFMENPCREHWLAVKWVFCYLQGIIDYCITYNNSGDSICGYVDSIFTGDLDKRRSTFGYIFTLAGGPICWMSKLQNIIVV